MNLSQIFALPYTDPMHGLIDNYSTLFEKGKGKIHNMKVHIVFHEQAKPAFCKAVCS